MWEMIEKLNAEFQNWSYIPPSQPIPAMEKIKITLGIRFSEGNSPVYSTEYGEMCPECSKSIPLCECTKKKNIAQGDGVIRVSRDTKGRNGKCVSLITGLVLGDEALKAISKKMKQKCGSGGTVKEGVIEIQGDHRELIVSELKKMGYTAKKTGG
jgi:translation initiation factor 1